MPATLIDLAARNVVDIEERDPGVFYVRLRAPGDVPLTAYERRVLDHLHENAHDGVVPAGALTTGPQHESARWRRGFVAEVVADARARGLSRDAVGSPAFGVLTAASAIPGVLVAAAWELGAGAAVVVGAIALLGWIRDGTRSGRRPRGWRLRHAGSASAPSSPRTRSSRPTRR